MTIGPGSRLGAYEITGFVGRGGMGQVFRARDTRLDRDVAIKVLADNLARDASAVARFEREAKAVARLSHPNILAIHDYSCEEGRFYAVMELLHGRTLRDALGSEAMPTEAVRGHARAIADGLAAAHDGGVIHRDLKPENIFLTTEGRVKILDFGLAMIWSAPVETNAPTEVLETLPGTIMGTVGYMSPEQIRGEPVTAATDVFAFGCVLYEMLTRQHPFERHSGGATLAAVLGEDPPPLPPSVPDDLREIVERCLAKQASQRYASARDLLSALDGRAVPGKRSARGGTTAKRIIVLPFRLLRADSEFAFLADSLPDAVTSSLTSLNTLTVRSTAIAEKFGSQADPRLVAQDTNVDWIVTGSVLRAGAQLRVTAQLVEAESGAILWSQTLAAGIDDIFRIQDELTSRVVSSLGERRSGNRDVPATALAYELFLRANQQAHGPAEWAIARELYRRALEEDPNFAPAHARLGRIEWLLAKYTEQGDDNWQFAERSLERALQLNPDLALAHRLYAELETDLGRGSSALVRLLERLRLRPNDAELWIALVKASRYCGLLDVSVDAHRRGRELDPKIASSVAHTFIMRGDYDTALEVIERRGDIGYIEPLVRACRGEEDIALQLVRERLRSGTDPRLWAYLESLRAAIERDSAAARAAAERLHLIRDPEAMFYVSRSLIRAGDAEYGLTLLAQAIPGFACVAMLERDPWIDGVRSDSRFARLLEVARSANRDAAESYSRHSSFM